MTGIPGIVPSNVFIKVVYNKSGLTIITILGDTPIVMEVELVSVDVPFQ
jgi:hypothetical protein